MQWQFQWLLLAHKKKNMPRLNIFQNIPELHQAVTFPMRVGTLHMQGINIPGSISFNNIQLPVFVSGTTARNMSFSFGLYSLTGSTLSLANSAYTQHTSVNGSYWATLATSATQDITPGTWWFGFVASNDGTGSATRYYFLGGQSAFPAAIQNAQMGGPFIRGISSNSTNGLPASVATSNLQNEGVNSNNESYIHPYIVISA